MGRVFDPDRDALAGCVRELWPVGRAVCAMSRVGGSRTGDGGLTGEIQSACDGRGRPLAFVVTAGDTDDRTRFGTVVDAIRVPRPGPGRPRVRPDHAPGDTGLGSGTIRGRRRETAQGPG